MNRLADPFWSNPFSTRFVRPGAIEYRFPNNRCERDSICDSLAQRRLGSIVGPHGSGKSTLLQSLLPALEQRYTRVVSIQMCDPRSPRPIERVRHKWRCRQAVGRAWQSLQPTDLLIIDGAEQLSRIDRWRMTVGRTSETPALLATSHQPMRGFPVLFATTLSRDLAAELTERLVRDAAPAVIAITRSKLAQHDWHQSQNLREFWFECYDSIQAAELQSATVRHQP